MNIDIKKCFYIQNVAILCIKDLTISYFLLLFDRPPVIRVNDKVMIPQDDNPEINFVGLLIGPRGNTLKNLEKDVCTLMYSPYTVEPQLPQTL